MTSGDEGKLFAGLPEHPAPERTYQDKPRLRMAERRQVELRAICLDDLVPTDHRVRMVWNFVEGLDVSALVAAVKAVEGRPGHPPADPRILLALWLYATADGVGSARELARLCDEHIARVLKNRWQPWEADRRDKLTQGASPSPRIVSRWRHADPSGVAQPGRSLCRRAAVSGRQPAGDRGAA